MAGMGPPPKPESQRRRRNPTVAMTQLPAKGRDGKRTPKWPLIDDIVTRARRDVWVGKAEDLAAELEYRRMEGLSTASVERRLDHAREQVAIYELRLAEQRKLEAALWRALWKLPQACEWERLGWTRDVAQYVRHKVLAELGELDDAKEARQWSDRLGLTPLAMLRLRWAVAPDEVAEKRQAKGATNTRTARPQDRLRVVDPSAVAGS